MKYLLLSTYYLLLTSSFLLLSTYYSLLTSHAETGLAIDRAIFDIGLVPGGVYSGTIKIRNTSAGSALPVHMSPSLWTTAGDSDDIEFIEAAKELNAASWFSFGTSTGKSADYLLGPDEEREIYFAVNPPETVSPGSYFVMLRFQMVPPSLAPETSGAVQVPEIGVLFFIKIASLNLDGKDAYAAEMLSAEFLLKNNKTRSISEMLLPRANAGLADAAIKKITAKIKNNGLYHFRLGGEIEIKNIFGRQVAYAPIPLRYFLPGKTRTIDIDLAPEAEDVPEENIIQRALKKTLGFIGDNSFLGRYTAVIRLKNTSDSRMIEDNLALRSGELGEYSVAVWIVPWKLWGAVLALFSAIFLVFFRARERVLPALRALTHGGDGA